MVCGSPLLLGKPLGGVGEPLFLWGGAPLFMWGTPMLQGTPAPLQVPREGSGRPAVNPVKKKGVWN